MDAPLMNANDGTPSVASLPNTRWPRRPISSTCSCEVSCRKTLRSAPTLKMNGLPVTAVIGYPALQNSTLVVDYRAGTIRISEGK